MSIKSSLSKKKIPTILGLLILFIGAVAGIFLVGQGTNFMPRASAEHAPKQVKITNINEKGFSVSWVTDQTTSGFIQYGTTTSLGSTMQDERDQLSGSSGNFRTHYVTIRGLSPDTKYYFKIGSGPRQSIYDNNGKAYEITTAPDIGVTTSTQVASGTVMTSAQTPAEGAILYLSTPNTAPISALVRASGSWVASLSSARTPDFGAYANFTATDPVNFEIIGPNGQTTTGTLTVGDLDPAPIITLGQNFGTTPSTPSAAPGETLPPAGDSSPGGSLQEPDPQLESSPATSSAQNQFNLDPLSEDLTATNSGVVLKTITKDGEVLNTSKPEFVGTAKPGEVLKITVESDPVFSDEVVVDENGDFAWTPPENLAPGEHTVTITKEDGTKLIRKFIVAAPGESELPALTTTPSGSTQYSDGRTSQPSTASGVPVAGILTPTLSLSIIGIALIFSGIILSRKMHI